MSEIIKLYNRYNDKVYLEHLDGNKWALKGEDNVFLYCRIGFADADNKTIDFVDPSGGPFLAIGGRVKDNKRIVSIEQSPSGYIFTLEDEDNKD